MPFSLKKPFAPLSSLALSFILFLIFAPRVEAGFFVWDTNGTDPGAGGEAPSGTWSNDPFNLNWSENFEGTAPTRAWDPGGAHVAFAAGGDATGTYTVTVDGTIKVFDMHFDEGTVTVEGGTLELHLDKTRLVSAPDGITGIINCAITGGSPTITNYTKYKPGTIIFGGSNTFTYPILIEGGTLQISASDRIADACNLTLGNGDIRPPPDGFVDTPATFHTGGFNETLGKLRMIGPNPSVRRSIDFGHGSSALVFADSDAQDWSGIPLYLVNYTPGVDSLRIGTDGSGFDTQLALIRFADFNDAPAQIDSNGFITPVNMIPVIESVTGVGTTEITITWGSLATRTYQLEYKSDLNETTWTNAGQITASSNTTSLTDFFATSSQRYYRVVMLP